MITRGERRWKRVLNGLIPVAMLALVLAYVSDPFVWEIGPKRIQISKGFKPVFFTGLLMVLRLLPFPWTCRLGSRCLAFIRARGFKRAGLAMGSVALFLGIFELGL